MKPLFFAASLALAASSFASSNYRRIDKTPFDAGRYTITVSHASLAKGGERFTVNVHLKEGKWPMNMKTLLSKVVVDRSSLADFEKRGLNFVEKGSDRTVTFEVTRTEIAKWHFEVVEYGESNGHPMPSLTAYLFPLNHPPVLSLR